MHRDIISDAEAQKWARVFVKGEMRRRGMTSEDLARELSKLGFYETASGVQAKISRGTFSFTFFAACMEAMRLKTVTIDLLDFVQAERRSLNLNGDSLNEITRLGRYVPLRSSKDKPNAPHTTILLPDPKYSSKRRYNALRCGECHTDVFVGWRVGDAKRIFMGQGVVGRCSVCDAYIAIPGSIVDVTPDNGNEDR